MILLTTVTPPHFVHVPSHGLGFHPQMSYFVLCSVICVKRYLLIVVDIGLIVDYCCFNVLFIIHYRKGNLP